MKTKNYIEEVNQCINLLDSLEKVKTDAFFETRQLAYMERKLNAEKQRYNWKNILKPVLIVMLLAINISIVYNYRVRSENYNKLRNKAIIQLSDNLINYSDYYSSN
ncbi:MAG: hypothetical protein NTZ33_15000 [Bacteroidetes bacterium]|nr:hypothetical protein [Bacteroidota bacterium]